MSASGPIGTAGWTLAEAAEAVAAGRISSRELVTACLERIERWQPRINAFASVYAQEALAAADRADEWLASGDVPGPLHGVPLAHKDMFYRPGRRSSMGSRAAPPAATIRSTLLARLDKAGAIELGTLNMAEFALGPTGHNEYLGHCRNPWNPDHIAAGSSSGGGAAVAARLTYGSLGSDTGGSVRLPACVNGVLGLKPTYGWLSGHGMMPLSYAADTPGVFARSARDLALILRVIAGHDPLDARTSSRAVPDYPALLGEGSLRGLRIGVPSAYFLEGVNEEVSRAVAAALGVLEGLGAQVGEVPVPEVATRHYTELSRVLVYVEASAIHGPRLRDLAAQYSTQVRVRAATGLGIPAPVYARALQQR
ncbi:MAG TPA: amidase, partial [Steroidobacteraceae bacterium]|nr:amidase [Steroidobacteraceae bacterium]